MAITQIRFYTGLLINKKVIGLNSIDRSASWYYAYRPQWPSKGFNSLTETRDWVDNFVTWYNDEHKHSKLNFVSLGKRHAMQDKDIWSNRKNVLEAAQKINPMRWPNGIRNCEPIGAVMLNPDNVPDEGTRKVA